MIKKFILISFMVTSMLSAASVETEDRSYFHTEKITAKFDGMSGAANDWIAIYPEGSSNDWENVIEWTYLNGQVSGTHKFQPVRPGYYDLRVFFNNTYKKEAEHNFKVREDHDDGRPVRIFTDKTKYLFDEKVTATYGNMPANKGDWMGVFTRWRPYTREHLKDWTYIDGKAGVKSFENLDRGHYEVVLFTDNNYEKLRGAPFEVLAAPKPEVIGFRIYESGIDIKILFKDVVGDEKNWMAIYPYGSSNEWENVIQWAWVPDGELSGSKIFDALDDGIYEVRLFFNNSFKLEAKDTFRVGPFVEN